MELHRRIGAYGVCRTADGQVLLLRAPAPSRQPETWFLPGGQLRQGEDPIKAVIRKVGEETGLAVTVSELCDVAADVAERAAGLVHTDGVIYELTVTGGSLRGEPGRAGEAAQWMPLGQLPRLTLSRFAARALGLALPATGPKIPIEPDPPGDTGSPPPRPRRGQRFGAYGLVTAPDRRVLLTLIADGYPGAGRWHLPGGGTAFGEQPAEGLLREITEEAGQVGRITGLVTVAHQHNPAALGPEGYPIDWHAVRAIFAVSVDRPTTPQVLDVGGSTADAAWFTWTEASRLELTDIATTILRNRQTSSN